jgi:hypothetical protein
VAPGPQKEFFAVLTEAINDMVAHGFDSMDRVRYWTEQIRLAAERASADPLRLEQMLSDALHSIYRKQVDGGTILRQHPGVSRFTLEKVRPALRAELDRRIMAAANLIKLNREDAIDKTLKRFQGWSTSLPGRDNAKSTDRPEVQADLRKAMKQDKFEVNRVLIDQGHKLNASLGHVLAEGGGAIALIWRSHWRQPGYNYREEHKERDGVVYLLRNSWAADRGYVKPGDGGYYDSITAVAEEPFCRCNAQWLYHLRELPANMITIKGQEAQAAARRALAS